MGSEPINRRRYLGSINPFVPFNKAEIEQSISHRFEQQVARYPEKSAVRNKGKAISYRSLNSMANRVARTLLRVCKEKQKPVGLLLENGEAVIAAILGVLKSGNIYVPLDPLVPRARTEFILRDSQAEVIVTNNRNLSMARELGYRKRRLVNLDEIDSSLSTANVGLTIAADNLAYVIYTSGSTGLPKGVMETHRNLLHNIMRNTNVLHICAEDQVSLLRSIGAAGAARDVLTALLNGATLCPFSIKHDGLETLARWLVEEGITIFTSVITVFRHFVATLSGEEQFEKLRLIYAGGEQVTAKDIELYQKHFPSHCLFVNRLGVSETGTVAYYFIGKDTRLIGGAVPVGYPAEDTEILLLDEHGEEVGPDCVGEIAVRSRYLSPGYWRNPELTRSVFLPDQEGQDRRIYRTGDLGRKLMDGCLFHLGWKDLQVNIRGHRIEVAEVETELLNHPGIEEVAVVGRKHWSGEIRLAAALVPVENAAPSADDVRKFLKDRLPDYMIPSAFMLLDTLPLGPNGKVDRRALPSPDWLPAHVAASDGSSRTELEEFITVLWQETLSLDDLGIHDNFFDLGGHSLVLGQIVSKLQAAFKIDLPLDNFFEQPTVQTLADIVRRALGAKGSFVAPIAALSRPDHIPLSFAQERLWFLHQLDPDTVAYNIPTATLIEGKLNVNALDRALSEVGKRHEALRTTFKVTDGQPVQVIRSDVRVVLPLVDLSRLSETESDAEARRLVVDHAQRPFDLSDAPLIRVILLKLSDDKHVFVTVHHIVADAWSVGVLFNELSILYDMYSGMRSSPLPDLPVQYADFAVWQRHWLTGEALESQISYWKKQLEDNLSIAELPADRTRPARETFRGRRQYFVLPQSVIEVAKKLSRREGTTLFMLLLAAFKVLLYRYTQHENVIVGSPIAGRNRAEVDNLIGLFVNTLVLRTDFSGNPSFRSLLKRVRDACLGAYAHQDLPFEKLVEELQPTRDLSRNPLFQVMFIFQNTPVSVVNFTGLMARRLEVDSGTAKFDLTLSIAEQDKKLIGFFEYNTDLFDSSTVERMIGHFQRLVEGIVTNPDQPLSSFPLLTETERHQLLVEWNDTAADYPKDSPVHELFEAQVERAPETIAVQFEGEQLRYRELNNRANQLAHHLRGLGVGPEKLVGICVERSLEMVVGLLGILKAGGAYVPLDPTYPRERLEFMLQDAQVSVLLTQESVVEDGRWRRVLSETEGMEDGGPGERIEDGESIDDSDAWSPILGPRLVCLDRDWPLIEQQKGNNLKQAANPQNLAYAIYTSGSTGQPKGVQIEHRSVVNCLHSVRQAIELTENDVFLALTTISFDIAALELFLPLITGAKLVLASRDEVVDAKLLLDRLKECGATVMQATPSSWKLLLDGGWRSSRNFKILCGGEVLSQSLADQLLEGGASIWNLYGPTETTIWSTISKVEAGEGPVHIGRPIANTKIYILDSHLQPVPIGVYGEICMGGDGLARGYLNRPELTAERFVPDPFSDQADSLLYRTGDRARYRLDGNIEFLGRLDNQVKIRGHRIELGEIEATLNQHPSVKECVVIASTFPPPRRGRIKVGVTPLTNSVREETPLSLPLRLRSGQAFPVEGEGVSESDRNLIAYLVSKAEKPSTSELRSFLKEKLPDYMVPSWFVLLDTIPLTPNEKIDLNALPPLDGERPQLDQGFVEPRTEIEELVAQIWREVLKLDKIGIHDNFFELGGHSLLATRAVARLRSSFNIDLPLRKLFELPTVAGLAELVDFLLRNQKGVSVPPIVPVQHDRPLLSFSQRRIWFLHKLNPGLTAYNIPARFRITGTPSIPALEKALNEIIKRHEVLRTRIIEIDGEPLQEILPKAAIDLHVVDLAGLAEGEAEAQRVLAEDACEHYNLAEAPLMRAKLLWLNERESVLILNFHHSVCDGSSLVIFYHELATLYAAFLDGKDLTLPSLAVQYADYAVWQHELLEGEALAAQLAYWKRQLGTGLTTLKLPTDYERPAVQTYRGARLTKALSEELTKALKDLSRQQGVTLFMTLLATFDILLSRHTGQEDITIGSTIAGRNRPETDRLIGFFINALALRTDLSGDPTFLELLKRVREVCLDAYTHQDLPFEKVVEEINPERDLGRNPLFQVLFNIADISERILELKGCQTVKVPTLEPEAKFDIVLHAPEVNGKLELAIVYNADLFTESRISSLLEQFSDLLAQIVENPGSNIDQYSLVPPSARGVLPDPTQSLDDTWEGTIHELFSRQANRAPDCPAVIDLDESWTYRQLDRQSNQLANYLIARGIQPRDVVAIYGHRSSPFVLAMLGVLRAGAMFVILDPVYPVQRLIDYLKIARPTAWLQMEAAGELTERLKGFLDSIEIPCRITLPGVKSDLAGSLGHYSVNETGVPLDADDTAYVAFTSGSTGQPKGVLCRHGPMTHFLPWQEEEFDLRSTDRFCLLSGLAYNHLHRDVFTPLALGATLYVPPAEIVREPVRLTQWLKENSISVLHLTPALGQLLSTAGTQPLPAVRRVFFGGDVLTRGEIARIRELAPNATIGSFYGATETQRAVGYYEIPLDFAWKDTEANRPIPLGRGIKDVQLLLLNKAGQLAGVGELGELYVRSPHLAEGYAGDETLTRERFLRNPFTGDPTDRLYRTGELGRYLPDGTVEWAGRNDRCVNIRGFRVELEEIESVLKQHPTVANAAIVLQDYENFSPENPKPETRNPKPDQRLVAYVVAEEEQQSLVDLLHSYASARLPDYMVPAHFVVLEQLPLSPNGKVDYEALPPLHENLSQPSSSSAVPQNEVQAKLRDIFRQVLAREQVGIEENFFRLGGHSLSAAQATARIKEAFDVGLELRTFLESPTVVALAKHIEMRLKPAYTTATGGTDREEIEL